MQNSSLRVRKRIATLFFLFTLTFLFLGVRLFWVHLVQGQELSEEATYKRTLLQDVESKRGVIYDTNMRELAISISTDSVVANPRQLKENNDPKVAAAALAQVLDMDENTVYGRIIQDSSYVYVKRQITQEQSIAVRALEMSGITLVEESKRYYPKGNLAAHILGISGVDNTGLEGIDLYYEKLLGGIPGSIKVECDAWGREMEDGIHSYIAPVDGADLILTVDETIQYLTERELDRIMEEHQPDRVFGIVMDPKTGAILALANRPDFDPNNYNDYPIENRYNFAVNGVYEPGSTMKIVTAAMLLEEGIVNRNSYFYCPGYVRVGVETINCSNNTAHGDQTFAQIVENSCNVGFVQAGLRLGVDSYYTYLDAFGFRQTTGIDLQGESEGIYIAPELARDRDIYLATMAMGQANAVTPFQLITAVSAIANDGKLMKPYLLQQAVDPQGNVVYQADNQVVRQVISTETARELCLILEGEVINGTGQNAYIEGYRVGGKTGTAQKPDPNKPGYLPDNYYSSFIGLAPVDDPRIVCLIVADNPKSFPYYGGTVAAPGVRNIINDTLRYWEVPLRGDVGNSAATAIPRSELKMVPDVVNLSREAATAAINARGFTVVYEGEGDIIWKQTPIAKSKLAPNSEVILYLTSSVQGEESGEVRVPDLAGRSIKQVDTILRALGLRLIPEGTGIAQTQSTDAGKVVSVGSSIKVSFQSLDEAAGGNLSTNLSEVAELEANE